jgi:molecular chaperone HtpG
LPKQAPYDLYDRDRPRGVRLYVKRVLIMEHCEDLVPEYLRFVRGLLDSDDLPLNVSRELLQENRIVKSMRKTLTSKVLAALEFMAKDRPEDYITFWKAFGKVFKEGLHFDHENREKLAELVRFDSSKEANTSLKDYCARMPADQDSIYYAIAASRSNVEGSPHIEGLVARGYEVLFMTDSIDEWAVMGLSEYQDKKLVSAMKANLTLKPEDQAAQEEAKKSLSQLTDKAKDVLKDAVSEVVLSTRLKDSPACIVVPEHGVHSHIERMLRAQGSDMPEQKPILELNPTHPIVMKLKALHENDADSSDVSDWLHLLHDQAVLAEGSPIKDPAGFARRMTRLMGQALGRD